MSIRTNPAKLISRKLFEAGFFTQTAQAVAVGENVANWNRYIRAGKDPGTKKVQRWLCAAAAVGVEIELTWSAKGLVC